MNEVQSLARSFGQRSEQLLQNITKDTRGRTTVKRFEFFSFAVESCLSGLREGELSGGLQRIIEWGRPGGDVGTTAGTLQRLVRELWEKSREHTREGDYVEVSSLKVLSEEVKEREGQREGGRDEKGCVCVRSRHL